MLSISFSHTGGSAVLQSSAADPGAPDPGQIRLRQTAIGLNFIDTYHRSGVYPVPLPSGLGLEAAGVVEAVGEGVTLQPGSRVGYCWGPIGAYASHRLIAADRVIPLPDGVTDEQAAAVLLKGCTTEFLVERCAKVQPGQVAVVTAAAGGVGLLLVQWLQAVGATVIAVAGSAEKLAIAARHGAHHTLLFTDDFGKQVKALTDGRGADVVFDGVGKASFLPALDALARRGLLVSFGNASGKVTDVDLGILAAKGSLFVTRPTLFDYYPTPADMAHYGGRVLDMVASGALTVAIDQRYPLADVARAHDDLEARRTTGCTVLLP